MFRKPVAFSAARPACKGFEIYTLDHKKGGEARSRESRESECWLGRFWVCFFCTKALCHAVSERKLADTVASVALKTCASRQLRLDATVLYSDSCDLPEELAHRLLFQAA